ncbi:MAG: sigma-54-dependent Fis family transcriptional regulator [Chromatiaceae bacterium]|nr:sigma-54-dependent Fis family transcriptional regulator [Gammaproteobacteria bacterium]MCP5306725.1 sigma-54-dependent Fis family transcriptional regulator [Chromatiaceae bacterium]MCP5421773.1 sigma-54-dependent Fis family transcriptional regulator [Chromatiaceae bacterium]
MNHLLIIEDEPVIRAALRRLLERHGHQVSEAESIEAAQAAGGLNDFNLIITDLRLPGQPGNAVLKLAPDVPVIIMTSYASVTSAVDAMKSGAADYIAKPFDHDEMVMLVQKVLREKQKERRAAALQTDVDQAYPVAGMIGKSIAMSEVCSRIHKVAPTEATVLITGESGTGKELVARALHKHSARADAAFIAFNCAAIPEQSIEAELFGQHQAERFRPGLIQNAEGGTLFLDEVGELPMPAQARLLRVLQGATHDQAADTQPNVRILAATHRDLRKLVQENAFRSDLYFRLRVVELNLPPLRERGDDVIELAVFLLDRARKQLGRAPLKLGREALEAIRRYHWPGNVRELSNAIERAVILCDGEQITPDLLAIDHRVTGASTAADVNDKLSLEEYFRVFVLEHQDQMTETELANALGISRKTLWERRQRFGLPRPKKRS